MKVTALKIPDVKLIEPEVFEDERGFFFESFNQQKFIEKTKCNVTFVQDNHSKSKKGVLRGLHYQTKPYAQGKLVRVIKGKVFDVALDIREDSKSFGRWVGEILSADNRRQLWIPEGFAHGFISLEDNTEFLYKATKSYSRDHERVISYDDPRFNIDWSPYGKEFLLSEKDLNNN
jgi:dTDP-4-dehydrorhamnose 3,5-epimerase